MQTINFKRKETVVIIQILLDIVIKSKYLGLFKYYYVLLELKIKLLSYYKNKLHIIYLQHNYCFIFTFEELKKLDNILIRFFCIQFIIRNVFFSFLILKF
jgi:hypothetical protein